MIARTARRVPRAAVIFVVLVAAGAALVGDQAARGQDEEAVPPADRIQSVSPEFTTIGSELCAACHPERVELSGEVRHLRILTREEEKGRFGGCEACHGRGSGHMETADPATIFGSNDEDRSWIHEGCLICHTQLSREKWLESAHWLGGETCNGCHSNHEPEVGEHLLRYDPLKGEREHDRCLDCHDTVEADFRYYSHHPVYEERLNCSDCHDVHEPEPGVADGEPVMDECVECHKDKKPPFVFEHEPLSSDLADGCLTCHRAHGSPNGALLKLPGRAVCVQCHTEQAVGHYGAATCWQVGCHRAIHGSNIDPIFRN